MQSAIGGMMRAQGMKQETVTHAAGTRHCVGDSDARLACKQENDVLREPVVGRSRRLKGKPAGRWLPLFIPSRFSLLFDGIERMVK
jgi:hypothetical protein